MNRKEIEALDLAAAKNIKTEKDLCDFSRILKKITVEAAWNAELDDHLVAWVTTGASHHPTVRYRENFFGITFTNVRVEI